MFCAWKCCRPRCRSGLGIATDCCFLGCEHPEHRNYVSRSLVLATYRQAERASQQLCFATRAFCSRPKKADSRKSRFNGVSWDMRHQTFHVRVWFQGKYHSAGFFSNDSEAGYAFDAKLRAICSDPVRLKKSLNFPTKEEASYEETLSEKRSRCLKMYSQSNAKDVESLQRLQQRFWKSPQASEYEIVNVPSQSRVDAVLQPLGSKSGGLALQLKSSSCHKTSSSEYYVFGRTGGYDGILLVLIALDRDVIWLVPGSNVSQQSLSVTLGSERDKAWRVSHLGLALVEYFKKGRFQHISLQDALMQCARNHIVEQHSHAQLASVLGSVGLQLHRPIGVSGAVDSVLSWQEHKWRVQEKATHKQAHGKYRCSLRKYGGCLGKLAYARADFDILVVSLLDTLDRLVGIFLLPSCVLAKRRLIGHKAADLTLYPPWALPKFPAVAGKRSWQLDYFVDLRSWKGNAIHLDSSSKDRLTELLDRLAEGELCIERLKQKARSMSG